MNISPRRLSWQCAQIHSWLSFARQTKIEYCSRPHLPLGPNAAGMPVDNALHGGQANPGSGKFHSRMKPLENSKKPARIGHVETCAIVAHIKGSVRSRSGAELDPR